MKVEVYCLNCESSNDITIRTKQPYMESPVEVWLVCKCGEERYLGEDGDSV